MVAGRASVHSVADREPGSGRGWRPGASSSHPGDRQWRRAGRRADRVVSQGADLDKAAGWSMGQGLSRLDAIRRIGVVEQTYYRWRKQYGGMGVDQLKELKRLQHPEARRTCCIGSASAAGEANISGTGNAEIRDGVTLMIQQAFDGFIRDMLPTQVRAIVNDRWGS
ncbi:hypothetical protein DPM13_03630 [Paracoccus mutanolyticus]|uniref:Transposase n=1 Tax=Paracoccus mutanolyticus TaxID=1499308 RepID=A0ABM6WPN2_9RHOB|nr:hypothetical protein DPM13_03630 [Paracoccus mutanolyticus]